MMATRTSGTEPPRSLTTEYDTADTLSTHKKACRGVACPSTHPTHPEKVTPFENMRYTLRSVDEIVRAAQSLSVLTSSIMLEYCKPSSSNVFLRSFCSALISSLFALRRASRPTVLIEERNPKQRVRPVKQVNGHHPYREACA